jgi:hypothetical protein
MNESWSERAKDWGQIILGWVYLAGVIVLIVTLFKGMAWIAGPVYYSTVVGGAVCLFVVLPICLLLAIFRKTRGAASIGLLICSFVWAFGLWITSFITAYILAGLVWMIIGLVFIGGGVIVIAIIAALITGHWSTAGELFLLGVIILATRFFAFFLAAKADNAQR